MPLSQNLRRSTTSFVPSNDALTKWVELRPCRGQSTLEIEASPHPLHIIAFHTLSCVCVCVCIHQIGRNRAVRPCHPNHYWYMLLALVLPRGINDTCVRMRMCVCTRYPNRFSYFWYPCVASRRHVPPEEFAILSVAAISTLVHLVLHVIDTRMSGAWHGKSTCTMLLEFFSEVRCCPL